MKGRRRPRPPDAPGRRELVAGGPRRAALAADGGAAVRGCGSRPWLGPLASSRGGPPTRGGWKLASELTSRGASTTDVTLAGNWKTSRMVAALLGRGDRSRNDHRPPPTVLPKSMAGALRWYDRLVNLPTTIRELSIQRLIQRFYAQRLINNVHRGDYVECMIELALAECDPAWRLTKPWTSWDLVNRNSTRIEVKQSAAAALRKNGRRGWLHARGAEARRAADEVNGPRHHQVGVASMKRLRKVAGHPHRQGARDCNPIIETHH